MNDVRITLMSNGVGVFFYHCQTVPAVNDEIRVGEHRYLVTGRTWSPHMVSADVTLQVTEIF